MKEKIYTSSSESSTESSLFDSSSSSESDSKEEDKKAEKRKAKLKKELKEALDKKAGAKKTRSIPQLNDRLAREEDKRLNPQKYDGSAQRLKKKADELKKNLVAVKESAEEEGAAGGEWNRQIDWWCVV